MAKLNIELVADAQKALGGLNNVTESTSTLLNQLIKGEKVSDKFADALSRDLSVAADKAGGGIKSLQAQLKELMKYQERARLGLGDTSDVYTTLNNLTKEATTEITRLTEAEKAAADETKQYTEATKSAEPATKQFTLSVKHADEQTTSYGKKLVSIAANIFKFQLLMGPITSAIRGFKTYLKESTQVAAEAEQVFNKLSTVFDTMSDSATKASESMSKLLGVSKSTAASTLSTIGDLLQAQGMGNGESLTTASSWAKQFADIIAFKDINMSLNEFAQNFMSGAAGNLRNFRTFGSIVKESAVQAELMRKGLDKLTGSELELAKMTTRAEIALRQQANAMGATEREWDTMLSINRRLSEASKQLKENFGSWLNESLKPIKTIWLEILDTINEAVASSKELPQFQENMKSANPAVLFSRESNSDLWERESRLHTGGWANMYGMLSESTDPTEISKLEKNLRYEAQQIVRMFVSFGMTVDEGIEALKEDRLTLESLTDEWYGDLDIFGGFIEYLGRYSEWAKRMLGRSEWDAETESVGSAFENFLESLRLLTGAGNVSSGEMMNANSHMSFAKQLAVASRDAAEQALNGINSADLSDFVDAVSLALGEATEEDMLKGKAETLKELYSILFNQFTKDGTLQENADLLKKIADEYKEITAENVELKNDWDDLLKKIEEATSSSAESLSRLRYQHSLTGTDAENARSLAYYDALAGKSSYAAQLRELGMEANEAEAAAQKWYEIQIAIANEEYDYAVKTLELEKKKTAEAKLQEAYNNAMSTIAGVRATNARNAFSAGLSNDAKGNYSLALYDILEQTADFTKTLLDAGYEMADAEDMASIYRSELEKGAKAAYEAALAQEALTAAELRASNALLAYQNSGKATDLMKSFQANISPMTASGRYAEADTWRANQKSSLRSTEAQLLALGVAASDVNDFIAKMIPLINKEYEAKKKDIDAAKEAEALGYFQKKFDFTGGLKDVYATGQEAFGGGVMGGIMGILLELVSKTEVFQTLMDFITDTVVPVFDAFLKPVLPMLRFIAGVVQDMLIDVMKPLFEPLKDVMQAIVIVAAVVQTIIETIKWLWDNVKVALHNIIETIKHPITGGNKWEYRSWENLTDTWAEIWDEANETLKEIEGLVFEIEENTDDDPLKVLNDLRDRGIINDSQYLKGARVVQKDMVFDPVSADSVNYVGSRQPEMTSIEYGDITININGGDPAEIERTLNRYFERQGIHYNMPLAMGGY